jgi:hypothetical protein
LKNLRKKLKLVEGQQEKREKAKFILLDKMTIKG